MNSNVTITANEELSGNLVYKTYANETLVYESSLSVTLAAGSEETFEMQISCENTVDNITVCLYDLNGNALTEELKEEVIHQITEYETVGFKYKINPDNTVEITGVTDTTKEFIKIPDLIENYPVVKIGNSAFSDMNITGIIIPNTIIEIDNDSFSGCDALSEIYYTGSEEEWNCITISDDNFISAI